MFNFLAANYSLFKALHLISVMSWMAGMLYLPRLYVYHAGVAIGSEMDKTFQIMEYKLLKYIMNPAMILSIILGSINAYIYGFSALGIWFHIKILAVVALVILHGLFAKWRKKFSFGQNSYSTTFYKFINELVTVLMIIAVIMVIMKPFE